MSLVRGVNACFSAALHLGNLAHGVLMVSLASWQVVWSAWLSTLGHAPMVDPTDFFQSTGMDQAAEGVSQAISHAAATPFGAHAVAAVSGAAKVCSTISEATSLNIWWLNPSEDSNAATVCQATVQQICACWQPSLRLHNGALMYTAPSV